MTSLSFRKLLAVTGVMVALTACGDNRDDRAAMDAALSSDLALASQTAMYPPQMYVSPQEMGYGYQPAYQQARPVYAQPAPRPRVVRTSTSASTRSDANVEIIRNTKRDAVIGATAGAVIGATTSRDKVKGAVIGAAAGGLLGAVIGHTVDVQRVPRY